MPSPPQKHDLSDSEDDEDYIPPEGQESESEASDVESNEKDLAPATNEPVDEAERKRAREALWSSFQESVKKPSAPTEQQSQQSRKVKIGRRYLFAGKEVVEVVEVPEDSQDAKKWPLWVDPQVQPVTTKTSSSSSEDAANPTASEVRSTEEGSSTPQNLSAEVAQPTDTHPTSASKPQPKRAGPRKSRITLAPLPGASKPKKMTTLDKSALDWKSHLQTESSAGSSVADELAANRRAGGYLEKVEFLKRVEERKDETLESLKSTKRRRL